MRNKKHLLILPTIGVGASWAFTFLGLITGNLIVTLRLSLLIMIVCIILALFLYFIDVSEREEK